MGAFQQQSISPRARNANRVTILIGDQAIGFAQTTSHSIDFGTQQLYGIGSAQPQEVQQMRVSPSITIDSFALTNAGLVAFGQLVAGQSVNLPSILANNQFNLHVVDGDTGDPLFTYVGCVASNFGEQISTNQPISDSITFQALDVLDASGQSILNVGSALAIPSAAASTGPNGLGVAVGH